MAIPYVVRKKADLTSGERKELWYGVPSKIQDRGGVQNKELAKWWSCGEVSTVVRLKAYWWK
mgnify:CR=1 FL=1